MRILVVNSGSSSLKLSVLDDARPDAATSLPSKGDRLDINAVATFITEAGTIEAVGHRIVHGGIDFTTPTLVDAPVRRQLEALTDLAPLHQPKSLAALDAVSTLLPDVPAVACFDTAFHATIPPAAATYALPAEWRRRWPLRRFGFHGLSHAYIARRIPRLLDLEEPPRIVSCHLGAGASVTAIAQGRSADTTMGFTPLEGLVMATRSGSVDPGLVLWLEEHAGIPAAELASTLEERSGLVGLAGTGDLRTILEAEAAGEQDAGLAVAVYLHRLRGAIASMAAAIGGVEVLVFTGGVGEHAPSIRQRASEGLEFLGIEIDPVANETAEPDCDISRSTASVRSVAVRAREDLQIASEVAKILS